MVLIAPEAEAGGKPTDASSVTNQLSRGGLLSLQRLRSPIALAIGLLIFYCLASLFMDPGGYLSTDTGGKTATVAGMSDRSDWSPDVGYWASEWDPTGELHPYWGTARRGDIWVNVTSLPMVLAARPLWDVGGERAVLLLPMLGSILAALAAGKLSVQFGAREAWPAVLLVGLASPAAIYALDFWEHSIGLALMGWGFSWVLDAMAAPTVERSRRFAVLISGAAGLAFGLAANLRQEALIYGFVTGLYMVWSIWRTNPKSNISRWLLPGIAMIAGTAAMLAANVGLERLVFGESARIARSGRTFSGVGEAGLGMRLTEAGITFASPVNTDHWSAVLLGAILAGGLIWTTIGHVRNTEMRRPLALVGVSVLVIVLRLVTFGPTFISGMLAAAPLAGAGMALAWIQKRHTPLVLALTPLPLVWFFQYPGAAAPQWGGRYILATGLLLTAYAMGQWQKFGDTFARWSKALVVASGLVTLIGLTFLSRRSHSFADGTQALADRPESVMIFDNPFLPRESGPVGIDERWLAAWDRETRGQAAQIVLDAGFTNFAFVGSPDENYVQFDGFEPTTRIAIVLIEGADTVFVTTYERVS